MWRCSGPTLPANHNGRARRTHGHASGPTQLVDPVQPTPCLARAAAALVVSAALGGCSLVPPDEVPPVALTAGWKTSAAPPGWIDAAAAASWQAGRWWELFDDAQLDALIRQVEVGNQTLARAAANVAQAEALLRQAQAQPWPTLGLQLGQQRSGRPTHGSASLGLVASWAPDVWGRLDAAVQAQGALVQASQADLAAARLTAQGSLAQAYFALRETDAAAALLDEIIVGYRRAALITGNRYAAGVAARTDLLQAQSTLESALAGRIALQRSRETYEHAIALLIGQPPAAFTLRVQTQWRAVVPAVPPQLPAQLLLRRPDIASAERAVAAANANIGVARGAYFPAINLSAGVGGGAETLAQVASAPTLAWALGLAVAQTLFDAGARSAAVDAARAVHAAAAATYRQTALAAFAQVEDQLSALATLAAQRVHARAAADAAAGAEERLMNSYQAGTADFTAVVTAQATTLNALRSVLQLQLEQQQAVVVLIQALGGGWQAPWLPGSTAPSAAATPAASAGAAQDQGRPAVD